MLAPVVNTATALGSLRYNWWPDWRDEVCAIVACGPSVKKDEVALLRERVRVIAIKEAYQLCPWADVVYGCDGPWWNHRRGLPEFKGLRLGWDKRIRSHEVRRITIQSTGNKKYSNKILVEEPGVIGGGGNSGFQAVNLAVQFGATSLMLVGFDMQSRSGFHFYGRNTWTGAHNPDELGFRNWIAAFTAASGTLAGLGIDVVNCSLESRLGCFRKRSISDTLQMWGM